LQLTEVVGRVPDFAKSVETLLNFNYFVPSFKSHLSAPKKKNVGKVSFLGFIVASNNLGVCADVNYGNAAKKI